MTTDSDTISRVGLSGIGVYARRWAAAVPWLFVAAVLAAAIAIRCIVPANTDISWLLTVGERVLDGQTLYRDVIETNPPIAVWTYIPGLLLGRLLSISPEIVTDALVFIAVGMSIGVSAIILRRSHAISPVKRWPIAIFALAVLVILPMQQFGQREHIAVIALLPMLAVLILRDNEETPPRWAVAVAGLGAGLMIAFKPHFAIALAFGLMALAIRRRSPRILLASENFIAAGMVGVYVAVIIAFYPDFFTLVGPLVRDVYIPVGQSFVAMMTKPAAPLWFVLALSAIYFKTEKRLDGPVFLLLATSAGFAVAFFLQRKGWPYHSYPMIGTAMLAAGVTAAAHRGTSVPHGWRGREPAIMLAIVFTCAMAWFNAAFDASFLRDRVGRLGPHPKILALTSEPAIGHPLVRAVGGIWVSRQQALWVEGYRDFMKQNGILSPKNEAAVSAHAARERAFLIEDILKNPPTIVLVDNLTDQWGAWLVAHPEVSTLLKDYSVADSVNHIDILTRRR